MRGFPRLAPLLAVVLGAGQLWAQRPADDPRHVSFAAADGFWIHADYYAPKSTYVDAPMVILLHGERSDRTAWKPLVEPLREAGFAVLAPDLRGYGESATSATLAKTDQPDPKLFKDMQHDLRGAYDWLARQKGVDRARFALVAAGAMAGVATSYATLDRSVDVIICLSPTAEQPGLDPRGDLRQLRGRKVLLLAGEDERQDCEQLASGIEGVEKRICPDSGHGTDLLGQTPKLPKEIADYLARGVGKPSQDVVYGSIERNIYHRAGSRWVEQIDPSNLRYYSSPQEAEARGLRAAKNTGPRDGTSQRRGRGKPSNGP